MTNQGWPLPLLKLVRSFLTERRVRVRLEKSTTPYYNIKCGTPQGSPLSPVLYMLYLAELLAQDPALHFGYMDEVCLYQVTKSLDNNVTTAPKEGDQPALCWLGVWFDRKLSFKWHISEHAAKA